LAPAFALSSRLFVCAVLCAALQSKKVIDLASQGSGSDSDSDSTHNRFAFHRSFDVPPPGPLRDGPSALFWTLP
jgi:hypothetical protein